MSEYNETHADALAALRRWGKCHFARSARKRIATPAEGMPPKRDAHRGAHPETAESCLGTGEMENRQTVQIGEVSGGGRAEAKPRTATAGADPEPAKSFVNAAAMREACANIAEYAKTAAYHTEDAHLLGYLDQIERWAQAALSAPPRNCDVGTAEEQAERYEKFCCNHWGSNDMSGNNCGMCPLSPFSCRLAWAQMPYEEGGGK